jgi:hypothetical protein
MLQCSGAILFPWKRDLRRICQQGRIFNEKEEKMNRATVLMLTAIFFFLTGAGVALAETHQKGGQEGISRQEQMGAPGASAEWFCPWCGASGGGRLCPGMMREHGKMHHGRGMHHGWSRGRCTREKAREMRPMDKEDVRMLMKNYVSANPNLKVGEIAEEEEVFLGEVVTKEGSLVEKLVIDKKTGWMKRRYE